MTRRSISPGNALLSLFGIVAIVVLFGAGMFAAIRQRLETRLRWVPDGRKPARAA